MSATSEESAVSELEEPVATDDKEVVSKRKFARRYGSRYEVFDTETALQTRGGLKKEDLMLSRTGKIVSRKKSLAAKALYEQYGFQKRVVKKSPPKKKGGRKKKTTKKKASK